MSGLLALLDDVAALTKLAAQQMDDIAGQAGRVGAKAAGVVIDDAAVTPNYVQGLPATRELPIVLKIARASLFNKLVILLPIALILNALAPWLLTPLLMLGGCYLCFEGAEKVWHVLGGHEAHAPKPTTLDAAHLEEQRVAGAIKTDFILSAEITAIALSAIESDGLIATGIILAVVGVAITVVVYGSVALLVKADDIGLKLTQVGRLATTRALGRGIVRGMPTLLTVISVVGTAAMLWVGGSILVHGLEQLGFGALEHSIYAAAQAVEGVLPALGGFTAWLVKATLDGVLGLLVGAALIPLVGVVTAQFAGKKSKSTA